MVIINIDGIDGVGKETVSLRVKEKLSKMNKESTDVNLFVDSISFPRYDTIYGKCINVVKNDLVETFGTDILEGMQPFFIKDRMEYFGNLNFYQSLSPDVGVKCLDVLITDRGFFTPYLFGVLGKSLDPRKMADWMINNYPYEIEATELNRSDRDIFSFILYPEDSSTIEASIRNRGEIDAIEKSNTLRDTLMRHRVNSARYLEVIKTVRDLIDAKCPLELSYGIQKAYIDRVKAIVVPYGRTKEDINIITDNIADKIIDIVKDYIPIPK